MKLYTGNLAGRLIYSVVEENGWCTVTVADVQTAEVIDQFVEPLGEETAEKFVRHAIETRILTDHEE